jgi:hypothetical protein
MRAATAAARDEQFVDVPSDLRHGPGDVIGVARVYRPVR